MPTLPDPRERTSQLWVARNFHNYISNVYSRFADEETREMFNALHKGLGIKALQQQITTQERMSSVSPQQVNPWERRIWEPVEKKGGRIELEFAPWDILGIKGAIGPDGEGESTWLERGIDYVYDRAQGAILFGRRVALKEAGGRRLLTSVDAQTSGGASLTLEAGRIVTAGDVATAIGIGVGDTPVVAENAPQDQVDDGRYWIPEMRRENPYLWNITAGGVEISREIRPDWYSPEHIPYWLEAAEHGLQHGLSSAPMRDALGAMGGNPFAYVAGELTRYERRTEDYRGREEVYAVIEKEDGTEVQCEVPPACWLPVEGNEESWVFDDGRPVRYEGTEHLKPPSSQGDPTYVRKFETLLRQDPVEIDYVDGQEDPEWSKPFFANRLSGQKIEVGEPARRWERQSQVWEKIGWDWSSTDPVVEMGLGRDLVALRDWDQLDEFGLEFYDTGIRWGEDPNWIWESPEAASRVGSGTPVLVRNITRSITQPMSLRRVVRNVLVVDEYIPESHYEDLLVVQVLRKEPTASVSFDARIVDQARVGKEGALEYLLRKSVPKSVSFTADLVQLDWEWMNCTWGMYDFQWSEKEDIFDAVWEEITQTVWDWNEQAWK